MLVLAALTACGREAEPRAQLVVVVDTDAHLLSELSSRSEVSPDSTIDALRITVLEPDGRTTAEKTFGVAEESSWPVSFGLYADDEESKSVRLRLTLFSARRGDVVNDRVDPDPDTSIDRWLELTVPQRGISYAHVSLRYDCLGRVPGDADTTSCIDAMRLDGGMPSDGVLYRATMNTRSLNGTWHGALEQPCPAQSSEERVCVPGGFAMLGSRGLVGFVATPQIEPVPLRPVIISPFLIDRFEYKLARFRALVQRGYSGPMPNTRTEDALCNWLPGDQDFSRDDRPLVCVRWEVADAICRAEGGLLPSEAQWEFAARGRGRSFQYPWGDSSPTCCSVSLGRSDGECAADGLERVGSHTGIDCSTADVTVDGIMDMAGSVNEPMRDFLASYTSVCWPPGIAIDPLCAIPLAPVRAKRSAGWESPVAFAVLARRASYGANAQSGLRCVYPAVSR
jgi:formylglycine-generating enzyme required for sulfatase activity